MHLQGLNLSVLLEEGTKLIFSHSLREALDVEAAFLLLLEYLAMAFSLFSVSTFVINLVTYVLLG